MSTTTWLKFAGEDNLELEKTLTERVKARIAKGDYSENDCKVIQQMRMSVVHGELPIDDYALEKLRHMCQLWDVDLRPRAITSHRKFIGPIIVASKKIFFPIIKIFLKDFIRQQRDFNAATIRMMGALSVDQARSDKQKK